MGKGGTGVQGLNKFGHSAPLKSSDMLALYKSDYYYYFFTPGSKDPGG